MAATEVTARIAPGQLVVLSQGAGHWREATCREVHADRLLLSPSKTRGTGALQPGPALFQTVCDAGILRCSGTLFPAAQEFEFQPDDAPLNVINRRQTFRVNVTVRAELAGVRQTTEEPFSVQWSCGLRDLSLGGARFVVPSPPPLARSRAMLRLELPEDEKFLILPCVVIDSAPKRNVAPMDALVRVKFQDLPGRLESQLGRYVNGLQIEMLRKGVRE